MKIGASLCRSVRIDRKQIDNKKKITITTRLNLVLITIVYHPFLNNFWIRHWSEKADNILLK